MVLPGGAAWWLAVRWQPDGAAARWCGGSVVRRQACCSSSR